MNFKSKSMKKIIFYNFLILIVVIFLAEFSIKMIFDITTQGISRGIINENSSHPRFNNNDVKNGKVFGKKVFTDKDGFRSVATKNKTNDYISSKPEVYFVGGSVTFGMGMDQENTFSGILNKEESNYNFYNAGVIGSDLKNNFYILKNKINKENLKNVFINFSVDDIGVKNLIEVKKKENLKKNKKIIDKIKNIYFFSQANKLIRTRSYTYVLLKNFLFDAKERYYSEALSLYSSDENIKHMKNYLNKIDKINKEIENKIIFMIIPYSSQVSEVSCKTNDIANILIEKEIKNRNFKYINFKTHFCREENFKKFFLDFDPSHLNKDGHEYIAKFIKKNIL